MTKEQSEINRKEIKMWMPGEGEYVALKNRYRKSNPKFPIVGLSMNYPSHRAAMADGYCGNLYWWSIDAENEIHFKLIY